MIDKLFAKMLSGIKQKMGLAPLEHLASRAGAPPLFPPMGAMDTLTLEGYNKKHGASAAKTLPGIAAAAGRAGERPLGGKQIGVAPRPLFEKRGS